MRPWPPLGEDGVDIVHDGVDAARAEKTGSTVARDVHAAETAEHSAGPTESVTAPKPTDGAGPSVTPEDIADFLAHIGVPETKTVGVGKTDVPGLEDKVFEGASPNPRKEGGLPEQEEGPIKSPSPVRSAQHDAEQDIANQFARAADEAGLKSSKSSDPSDLSGHTLTMRIDNKTGICSTCKSGLRDPGVKDGVLKQLSKLYPSLTIHVVINEPGPKTPSGRDDFLIRNGQLLKVLK